MNIRTSLQITALAGASFALAGCPSRDSSSKPASPSVVSTSSTKEAAPDPARAKEILQSSRDAVAKLQSLAYTATVTTAPAPSVKTGERAVAPTDPGARAGTPSPATHINVLFKKTDLPTWKVVAYTSGASTPSSPALRAAYDEYAARLLDDQKQTVWQEVTDKLDTVRSVFARASADRPVAWELLSPGPWTSSEPTPREPATIDGVRCEVIELRSDWTRLPVPPAPPVSATSEAAGPAKSGESDSAKPDSSKAGSSASDSTKPVAPDSTAPSDASKPADPPKQPDQPAPQPSARQPVEARVVLYLGVDDHLPRRIVRESEGVITTADITAIETDKNIPDSYFYIDAPSGYAVRRATPAPVRAPRPAPERPSRSSASQATFSLPVGSAAPQWTLKDPAGKDHKLSDYKGKVVVLDFWGSWCPPCRAAMPGMQKLHEKYKNKGVAVLGLNFEQTPSANPEKFMKDQGFDYGLLLKAETIASDYKITGWPTFFILDTEGKIVWSAAGFAREHEAEMAKIIDDLIMK